MLAPVSQAARLMSCAGEYLQPLPRRARGSLRRSDGDVVYEPAPVVVARGVLGCAPKFRRGLENRLP